MALQFDTNLSSSTLKNEINNNDISLLYSVIDKLYSNIIFPYPNLTIITLNKKVKYLILKNNDIVTTFIIKSTNNIVYFTAKKFIKCTDFVAISHMTFSETGV